MKTQRVVKPECFYARFDEELQMLFRDKKQWSHSTCYNMDDARKQFFLVKEAIHRRPTYCMTPFIGRIQNRQIYRNRK